MRFEEANELLRPGYLPFESGYQELDDGKWVVAARTRMPGCRAKMVNWWFSWLGDIQWYRLWHPTDHVYSGWENRLDGNYIGASHLVHEYLAGQDGPLYKLRVDFYDPLETFDGEKYRASSALAVCARPGLLEAPIHVGRMCHLVRNTDYGCEMRSRFWLGMISHRDPIITLPETQVRQMRAENLDAEFSRRLHQHSVEEMGYLAEILPTLYKRVTLDNSF
jgi:DAPG hydrolase PhiG domain